MRGGHVHPFALRPGEIRAYDKSKKKLVWKNANGLVEHETALDAVQPGAGEGSNKFPSETRPVDRRVSFGRLRYGQWYPPEMMDESKSRFGRDTRRHAKRGFVCPRMC